MKNIDGFYYFNGTDLYVIDPLPNDIEQESTALIVDELSDSFKSYQKKRYLSFDRE